MDGCSKVILNIPHHFHWVSWQIPSLFLFPSIFKEYKTREDKHLQKYTCGPQHHTQIFQAVPEKQPPFLAQQSITFDM